MSLPERLQAIALQMFYGSHLGIVSRRLSSAIAGGDAKEIWAAFKHCYEECKMDSEGGEEPVGPPKTGLLLELDKKKGR